MGLQIRSDLFASDNKDVQGGKSINIVDNMQRLLTEKKARDLASKFDQVLKEKKRLQVSERLKEDSKTETYA